MGHPPIDTKLTAQATQAATQNALELHETQYIELELRPLPSIYNACQAEQTFKLAPIGWELQKAKSWLALAESACAANVAWVGSSGR